MIMPVYAGAYIMNILVVICALFRWFMCTVCPGLGKFLFSTKSAANSEKAYYLIDIATPIYRIVDIPSKSHDLLSSKVNIGHVGSRGWHPCVILKIQEHG